MTESVALLEFDPDREAVLSPTAVKTTRPVPRGGVICFFQDVLSSLVEAGTLHRLCSLRSEMGSHPVYVLPHEAGEVVVFHPGVGAPLAAGFLEEVIALGVRDFIACGGAGVLAPAIAVGHLLLPTAAIREEGTSFHYLPPAREVAPHPTALAVLRETLADRRLPVLEGKTWTTDAIYRETRRKIDERRAEGCLSVEMEAAAFFAVAQFRGARLAQVLYGGDDLSGSSWDHRDWDRHHARGTLFGLAVEACQRLMARPEGAP